jgi:hypothetical protein
VDTGIRARADAGEHGRGLGEDLGVRADADLEVLRPRALRDQHLLETHRLGRAGLEAGEIVADDAVISLRMEAAALHRRAPVPRSRAPAWKWRR